MGDVWEQLQACNGFDWDEHNVAKNWDKHAVTPVECEQALTNRPLIVASDTAHSQTEARYYVLGRSDDDRRLFLVFTIRQDLVRVVSARDMSRKERKVYESYEAP